MALVAFWSFAGLVGCQSRRDDRLVVATTWASAECSRLGDDFERWRSTKPARSATSGQPGIRWVWLSRGDDLGQFARKRGGVDVLLGGAVEVERTIGPAENSRWSLESAGDVAEIQDSYSGPRFLQSARAELNRGTWISGYERLVLLAARGDLAASAATERSPSEGAAILAGGHHREAAAELMAFLVERRGAKPEASRPPDDATPDGLLADLLRATLIDSREELGAAWRALKNLGDPSRSLRWMCEPPPWPPASVTKIQSRNGDQAMTMIETLAGQIAPDARPRAWLLRSWLMPVRPIDGALLGELSRAEEGRLMREPRFRAWLRAEWTAWARQRYRRVARQARAGLSVAVAHSSPPTEGAATR